MVNIWSNLIQFLLPNHCLLCRMPIRAQVVATPLCPGCTRDLPWLGPACHSCGLPLAVGSVDLTCGRCQQHPPPFQRVHAPWRYDRPLDALILRMKFGADPAVAKTLGELLAISLAAQAMPRPDLLLPVPLHPRRLRQRGFNQALEIARPIARRLQLPIDTHGCTRRRDTRAQSDLPVQARRANVRGAFELNRRFERLHVTIIDDVMTSGYTVAELARQLRRHGAEQVSVWCCARTVN